ncbi:MAG TPA: hypothetical protein VGW38_10905, partial [Chloroflexota bacterium]|nr:hypothetical protein [Chloroflexota bacterium]
GKLARSIPIDLALFDTTGDEAFWQRALQRAAFVVSRLAPDPEHGGYIYLPGRFDPRNCSNSVIDSGECTDALAHLLLHPRAARVPADLREGCKAAIQQNAETYLRTAVVEKEITNQRLWGAMGLATAYQLEPQPEWLDAIRQSLHRSIAEQRSDGSWGYQPHATQHGAHPGAADLTVYYHSRCLAFMLHIVNRVPASDPHCQVTRAVERGISFLTTVITPDGLKPLSLEGKRWFWSGSYEAGSNAYDVFALLQGASRFGQEEWRRLALPVWRQLLRHQQADGAILACLEPGARDFVCRDFHTADLAWPVQVMDAIASLANAPLADLPSPRNNVASATYARDAGVVRLDGSQRSVLVRTAKAPANTQFGGAVGGGSLAAVVSVDGQRLVSIDREGESEGAFVATSKPSASRALPRLRHFLRENPPRREGAQWSFVSRVLLRRGQWKDALSALWFGYALPLTHALRDVASSRWATTCEVGVDQRADHLVFHAQVARPDGSVPEWARHLRVTHEYRLSADGLV